MEKEIPLYKAIYNKIVNRILVGSYPKGYQLASAQKIHARYGVGYTSIRRAMHLLEQDGFIRQEARRRPTVVFDPEDEGCRRLRQRVFLSHLTAHADCYRALPYVLPGLVCLGARQPSPRLLRGLRALCAQPEEGFATRYDLLFLAYAWQSLVVEQAGSALAADLFLQIHGFDELRFTALPPAALMPGEVQGALETLRYWTDLVERGALEDLYRMISIFCLEARASLERAFCPLAGLPELQEAGQVEFRWYLHQIPAPLYQKIAFDLMRTACLEGLNAGDALPAEAALIERYGVAAVTVRSAIALLSELGLTHTVNGVGTLLTGRPARGEGVAHCLRQSRESLQILAACSYALASQAAPALAGRAGALRSGLCERRAREGAVLWLLGQLVSAVPSQALAVVFEQLETQYLFGLYASGLPGSPGRAAQLNEVYRQADACLALLEAGDKEGFAARLCGLCRSRCAELKTL